jgi:hypothetical protein
MTNWVCEYCGATGRTREGTTVDQTQCPTCGEPVVPLPGA